MYLIPLKQKFYELLQGKSQPKSTLEKIGYANFCKLAQIRKKVCDFRQGVPPFDIK